MLNKDDQLLTLNYGRLVIHRNITHPNRQMDIVGVTFKPGKSKFKYFLFHKLTNKNDFHETKFVVKMMSIGQGNCNLVLGSKATL